MTKDRGPGAMRKLREDFVGRAVARGKFVVIDVATGDYEVSDDGEAFGRAEEKHPEAVFFVLRVGPEGAPQPAYRIGAGGDS